MRRLVIAAAVGAAVVATAVPSLAGSATPTPKATLPVGVTYSTDGGVFVGTTINGQPGFSAAVANGHACIGFSYEVPFCADLPGVTVTAIPRDITIGPAHVYVNTSNGGVAVGTALGDQPLVGAGIGNGWLCIGFSEEIPFCYPLNQNTSSRVGHPLA